MAPANPRPPTSASACPAPAEPVAAPCTATERKTSPSKALTRNSPPPSNPSSTTTSPKNTPAKPPKPSGTEASGTTMKQLLFRSLVVALLMGACMGICRLCLIRPREHKIRSAHKCGGGIQTARGPLCLRLPRDVAGHELARALSKILSDVSTYLDVSRGTY